ncbi:zinc transporter ZIP1 [Eurytemora carolleeae]|uniref:zinc transporter ZIP1 n=1 Tax=Eurytemora carolleeae TaxID=1294199 RepID=UPI000C759426|nr:zinc transporter ZIP1 [Eurytemora carolleeae]|eukprot:XP_023329406.1 zinc transporter ZIP1-like [Eurytemora affinis]
MTTSEEDSEGLSHITLVKIYAAVIIVILSLAFGFLPLILSKRLDFTAVETSDPEILKKHKKKFKNVLLSFLLNLGGGVLLANCFCHWLPEVREEIELAQFETTLPVAELIMCSGFFFICFLEELLHHFLHPHKGKAASTRKSYNTRASDSETNFRYRKNISEHEMKSSGEQTDNPEEESEEDYEEDEKEEKKGAQIKSAIRTFFIISALSFHSTVEGLALSLEGEAAGVWMVTGATALHKFVISFSVGVELIASRVGNLKYTISICVFSFAPAVGVGIGILLTELSKNSSLDELPLQIMQGVATGTVIYVVFMEILPKAKSIGGTGFQHVTSMILGFAIFLPSLYFRKINEELSL